MLSFVLNFLEGFLHNKKGIHYQSFKIVGKQGSTVCPSELRQPVVKKNKKKQDCIICHRFMKSNSRHCVGSNHHPERAARSDRIHLLRQDGNSDTERYGIQEVHHRGTQLWYRAALFHLHCFVETHPGSIIAFMSVASFTGTQAFRLVKSPEEKLRGAGSKRERA